MASSFQTLLEELQVARERGDLDKVAELEALLQLQSGNNPPGGARIGQEVKRMMGMKKGGAVKKNKPKKGSAVRGAGIARQGVRKAKII
jgi:hypothetical protein